ncbi:MAG: hypothetical protein Q9187_009068, partial [Circinaria calcarea]
MFFTGIGKRRLVFVVVTIAFLFIVANLIPLSGSDIRSTIDKVPIPGRHKSSAEAALPEASPPKADLPEDDELESQHEPVDAHPIS